MSFYISLDGLNEITNITQNVLPAIDVSLRWQMENLAIGPSFMIKRFRLNVFMSKQTLFYFNFIYICISIIIIFTFYEGEFWSFCCSLLLQLSRSLYVCLSVCLSVSLSLFLCLSVCLPICLLVCLSETFWTKRINKIICREPHNIF